MNAFRWLAGLALTVLGLAFTIYGLFAFAFREGDGSTYVMIGGHRADARLAGVISLVVGLAAILCAGLLFRRRASSDC